MPSPIGHILAGSAVYLAGADSKSCSNLLLGAALIGSILPDFDFLPGILIGDMRAFHHGISHSLAFAVLFGVGTLVVSHRVTPKIAVQAALIGFLAYASHLILDAVSVNPGARGVPLFWPIFDQKMGLNLQVFGHFQYADIRNGIWSVVRWDNLSPLIREALILGSLVGVLFLKRRMVNRSVK